MKKTFKLIPFLLVLISFSLFGGSFSTLALQYNEVPISEQILVFDNNNTNRLPNNFRKSTDPVDNSTNLNLSGLKELNISGSQQFSKFNLELLKKQLPSDKNLVFIDLRQESHGFINGLPISWEGDGDKANMGLNYNQVIARNNAQLSSIKIGEPLTIKNTTIVPKEVYSEETLIKENNNQYIRIPVTDTKLPTPEMVDLFVSSVTNLPENSWLHFHCKAGIGRTTTFMTMFDMMKNAKTVPLNDIVLRQIKLANLEDKEKGLESATRMAFYNKFYAYAKNGDFTKKFSEFNN